MAGKSSSPSAKDLADVVSLFTQTAQQLKELTKLQRKQTTSSQNVSNTFTDASKQKEIPLKIPLLDPKRFNDWKQDMKAYLRYKGLVTYLKVNDVEDIQPAGTAEIKKSTDTFTVLKEGIPTHLR